MTLEETIALLAATLEATHDAIVVVDLDLRVVRYNQHFLRMVGLAPEQVDGRSVEQILASLGGQNQIENIDELRDELRQFPTEASADMIVRFKDGRCYHRFVAPQFVDGRMIGRVASYRDISETNRAQQALEQHRAFLEKAQEVAHIGSWVAELDASRRLGWSAETHRIFGITAAEFSGTSESSFARVHPDDRESVRRACEAAAAAGGPPFDIEHRIVRADGEIRWVHEKADVVRDAGGVAVRMIATVQDITERRQLEDQLRQAQKLEAIGRLAGGVAHDMNNALTAIVGYTELTLVALPHDDPVRPDVQEIRRAAERAESVTRQLLAFSRKQLLEPRVFYVSQSIATLGRMLERLLGGDIELTTLTAAYIPPIYGDPGQIEQALVNLAVNARDAMPSGGRLTLRAGIVVVDEAFARAHRPMPPGQYVEVIVTDTGQGMSPETQAHIFEPFFTTKGVSKGTGLGLAMVYGTVKQSGGFIFVDSAVDQGTTFRLYFPPVRSEELTPALVPSTAEGLTMLVADDDPAVRMLVASALKTDGYHVLQAESGSEALTVAADHSTHIHLLLTDANMPGMSGIELAAALAKRHDDLKVVVMSGYTPEPITVPGLSEPVGLLPKPFTTRELRQKVREVLGAVHPLK